MVTYVVASKAQANHLSDCQLLGEYLELNCPDVSVKYVIKDNSEWPDFIDAVVRSYGFASKTCPIIYTLEGTLIGDGPEFIDHVREIYGKELNISGEQKKSRVRLNKEENDERMRIKKEGDTKGQKIEKKLAKISKKKIAELIDDCFYKPELEAGFQFFVRRGDFFRQKSRVLKLKYGRSLNIVDEILEKNLEIENEEKEEAKLDQTWEQFLAMYEKHLEGDQKPRQERPDTAKEPEDKAATIESKKGREKNDVVVEETEGQLGRSKYSSIDSGGAFQTQKNGGGAAREFGVALSGVENVFELPDDCKLEIPVKALIDTLDENYVLVAHPFPQIEGEMLLFQRDIDDQSQEQEGWIVCRDYSLRKRVQTQVKDNKKLSALARKKLQDEDKEKTKLQCLEVDLEAPLSTIDWTNVATIVTEVSALAWFQILPTGQKSSFPFQFNCIHVLPSSQMVGFPKLPLDVMIKNKLTFAKKQQKMAKGENVSFNQRMHKPIHAKDMIAGEKGILLVDEFLFPHGIYTLQDGVFSNESLKYGYDTIAKFIKLTDLQAQQGCGVTVLVSPQWIFVGVLNQPYYIDQYSQQPHFLDGFAYAGILNLQTIKQEWPNTTGIGHKKNQILTSLHDQAKEISDEGLNRFY